MSFVTDNSAMYHPDSLPQINKIYVNLKEALQRCEQLYFRKKSYLLLDSVEDEYNACQSEKQKFSEENAIIKNKLDETEKLNQELLTSNENTEHTLLEEIFQVKTDVNVESEYMSDEFRQNILKAVTEMEEEIKRLSSKYKEMIDAEDEELAKELKELKEKNENIKEQLIKQHAQIAEQKMADAKVERDQKLNLLEKESEETILKEKAERTEEIEREKQSNLELTENLNIQYQELVDRLERDKQREIEKANVEHQEYHNKLLEQLNDKKKEIEKIEKENKILEKEGRRFEIKIEDSKKFIVDEKLLRRELACQIMEIKGNIRVFCRVRPVLQFEIESGDAKDAIQYPVPGDISVIKDESSPDHYEFDCIFKPDSTQEEVFFEVYPYIQKLLEGYNVCIFAYGQTGSGKTFTMEGPTDDPGVNRRSFELLFELAGAKKGKINYGFTISMLEIYNEHIYDLLADRNRPLNDTNSGGSDLEAEEDDVYKTLPKLKIKMEKDGTFYVDKLIQHKITNMDQVNHYLDIGKSNRFEAAHAANEHSSRSHLVVILSIVGQNIETEEIFHGSLNLIDLAGSERVNKTEAAGKRLVEAKYINKSLSALGNAIKGLGEESEYIPYRDSKLTHLLKDALSGKSKVLMFTNVTPAHYNVSETISTLQFGTRCRRTDVGIAIKNYGQLPSHFRASLTSMQASTHRTSMARLSTTMKAVTASRSSMVRKSVLKSDTSDSVEKLSTEVTKPNKKRSTKVKETVVEDEPVEYDEAPSKSAEQFINLTGGKFGKFTGNKSIAQTEPSASKEGAKKGKSKKGPKKSK